MKTSPRGGGSESGDGIPLDRLVLSINITHTQEIGRSLEPDPEDQKVPKGASCAIRKDDDRFLREGVSGKPERRSLPDDRPAAGALVALTVESG